MMNKMDIYNHQRKEVAMKNQGDHHQILESGKQS